MRTTEQARLFEPPEAPGGRPVSLTPRRPMPPYVRVALLVGDLLAVLAAYTLAATALSGDGVVASFAAVVSAGEVWAVLPWPLTLWLLGLYDRRIDLSVVGQWAHLAVGATVATMLVLLGLLLGGGEAAVGSGLYELPIASWVLTLVLLPAARLPLRTVQKAARRSGMSEKRTLIIGAGEVGTLLAEKMRRGPELGLVPVGFLDPDPPASSRRDAMRLPVYRDTGQLDDIIEREDINHVLLAFLGEDYEQLFAILERCSCHSVEISVVPRLFEISAARPRTDIIEGIPIMSLKRRELKGLWSAYKRALDVVVSAVALAAASPVLLVTAACVRLGSGAPVLFRQTRVGRDGVPFTMYKFRSMVQTAEEGKAGLLGRNESTGPLFKMREDPRVTRVGRFIRRYSIDELPQLFNVLVGDMSLVGPRPALPEEVARYSDWQLKRLGATPGITGLWQILGRVELSFDEMVSLDLNYIWNWSPGLDFAILARTAGAVIDGRGAC